MVPCRSGLARDAFVQTKHFLEKTLYNMGLYRLSV